jgi:alpha-2-macroglobulin
VPEQSTYRPGETVKLRINADRDDARVLLFIRPENGICPLPKPIQLQAKSQVVEIEVTESDQPNFFVEAVSIYGGRIYQEMIEIIVPPEERQLEVTVRSDRSEYLPGQEAELELRISDAGGRPVESSLAVAVYDRALQSLGRDVLPPDIRQWFWKWQRGHYPQRTANLDWSTYPVDLQGIPSWVPLGIFGDSIGDDEGAGLGFARRGGGMGAWVAWVAWPCVAGE